jgi:Tol biopolymer transport system component
MARQKGLMLLLLTLVSIHASTVSAQYFAFGKNKVQYKSFDWRYVQSRHFDVYFTEGGEYLAKFTADAAEAAYLTIRQDFKYEINARIALIVFKSHNDFQQNNVIGEYLPEGVGGVTELYKNRVVLPYEGDYKKFRHVIHHELIHAVVNDMVYGGSVQNAIQNNIRTQVPLWFNEGIAEYQSLEWDTNSDMFITDAIINNYLAPIPYLNGYFAYRGGQSVWKFVSQKYGREKIAEIMNRLRATRSVDLAFRGSLGLSVEELSEKWQRELKVQYWPEIAKREDINTVMKKLTDHRKDGSNYNTSPAISPQGDKFAFITDRNGIFDIYLGSTINPDQYEKLIDGQRSPNFEELKILTPGLTWSPDGKKLALATKAGDQDAIMVIDIKTRNIDRITFELDAIYSVDWSPDGFKLAFIGQHDYKSDVYIYDFRRRTLTNLTDDVFSDQDPVWSPDGKKIYFSSDRQATLTFEPRVVNYKTNRTIADTSDSESFKMKLHDYSETDLYEIDLDSTVMKRLTATQGIDEASPVPSPDGKKLMYVSDYNGVYNLYTLTLGASKPFVQLGATDPNAPSVRAVTNLLTGARSISISQDGSKLLCVGLDYAGFDIFMLRMPFERSVREVKPDMPLEQTPWGRTMVTTQIDKFADVTGVTPELRLMRIGMASTNGSNGAGSKSASTDTTKGKSAKDSAMTALVPKKTPDVDTTLSAGPSIDVRSFVFDRNFSTKLEAAKSETGKNAPIRKEPKNTKTEDGDYKVKRYRVNFSPDIVYGGAGYDAVWGAQGSGIFAFSDLLGNHQLVLTTNLQFDLQNSNYGISYGYLANRMDYFASAYHTARFLQIGRNDGTLNADLFRFRVYGGTLTTSYPLNRFKRMEFGLGYLTLTKENLNSTFGNQQTSFLYPSFTFTHDDSRPFLYSPIAGTRYAVGLSGTAFSNVTFASILFDYRTYYDFWSYYSFVIRFSGAASFGATPQRYFIGGTENWINRSFANNTIPINDVQDFIFTTPAIPMRGYPYNALNGTRFALANVELRYPFLQYLAFGPVPIPFYYLQGVLFLDVGSAWTGTNFRSTAPDASGNTVFRDILMGYGWGFRTVFLGIVVRYDMAWANNLSGSSLPTHYVSIGGDF